jgi:hypothetical protein
LLTVARSPRQIERNSTIASSTAINPNQGAYTLS